MKITIDNNSGFCFGVVYAVERAEQELKNSDSLYCLGDIVHNSKEVERLSKLGLKSITHEEFKQLKNTKVLIRAHGEPPETYRIAAENNIRLIDASCPVVLRLQKTIKHGNDNAESENGQSVIYGKKKHAEVIGLLGQTKGKGMVISNFDDLDKIDYTRPVHLYSQTTMSLEGYAKISGEMQKRMKAAGNENKIQFSQNDTICRQVSGRDKHLRKFAAENDVIIFVSGKKSSNGKALYGVCKAENDRSYFISDPDSLKSEMFKKADTVGICGATSTPLWLMEQVKEEIESITA
jgi:4-hydroxy-3-methylbut-2-en-1-yl diphosphate reductase